MKLVILGGAGVRTVFFTNGVAQKADLMGITELVLFDTDEKKLAIMGALSKYAAQKANPALAVSTTLDIREAVSGADYVVTTIRVGYDEGRVIDEDIAMKHGVLGQETTGIGGFSMALRTIPVMKEYCRIIKELAPKAWIFNFTNPSGLVTQALRDAGYDRVLG
ncbi:MAG TPA: glycoside hydrolase, partial [Lachnoclostridium sp.]|nr:glycoside hydrolase [Lachnoclostridium sp.]